MDSVELILVVFELESQAKQALNNLKTREKKGLLQLFNAAVLSRDAQGITDEERMLVISASRLGREYKRRSQLRL